MTEKQPLEEPLSSPSPSRERPTLRDKTIKPEGAIPRQAQAYVIAGIAIVIALAVMFSNNRPKPSAKDQRRQPVMVITEGNEKNIADFGEEMNDKQRAAQKAHLEKEMNAQAESMNATPETLPEAQSGASEAGTPRRMQPTSEPDPLLQHERELTYNSRFASNFAFSSEHSLGETKSLSPVRETGAHPASPEDGARLDSRASPSQSPEKRPVNVNVNSAQGQPYVVFEGTELETALVNRLDGDFSGPVKVLVTNPIYSHDRQHVLIPEGTCVVGETSKVQGLGERRLAVIFHRMIMPDGYTVDLDQFRGLNQIGETGLKDYVNHHYAEIFGSSIALGVIAGAAESSNSNAGLYQTGSEAYRSGIAASLSQSATQVLDRFLNIPPTLTIREGHRVKVYFTQDLLLPAYENHTVPSNI